MDTNIEKAARLLLKSKYATCLTGAGISVESGIRPFRGPGGLWTEKGEPPMDGYQRFTADPQKYWENIVKGIGRDTEFARTIDEAKPHGAHYALAELEKMGILKYLITQNIDNLHLAAGSQKVAEIHGNMKKLRCIECNTRYGRDAISLDELPPRCPKCRGVIKNDTVMFGEPIPYDVLLVCQREADKSDCMLTVGTSVFVYPAAGFPLEVKRKGGVLIEVNLYETEMTALCDVSLQGKAGEIMPQLVECMKTLKGH
ncbi:MAG: NAD-dependent deacylase [Dehalococcoidales bacterium]|nr:NAD-dependent deacylase [Dehalococcoidales bacterium]